MTSEKIITLSDAAVEHIQTIIDKRGGGIGFRIAVKQTGCTGYMYQPEVVDAPQEGDIEVLTEQGLRVFVDPQCVAMIKGTHLDYVAKSLGMKQLEFNNPNVDSLCGCGESFNLKEQGDNDGKA